MAQISSNLLWASTGGGWRAMFGCVGYANVFQQAGLFSSEESLFRSISTVSGGSWFSTQFFYSREFYDKTALAPSPQDINDFVVEWMNTYLDISTDIDNSTRVTCNFTDFYSNENYDPERDYVASLTDICYVLVKYDFDWALFISDMLESAATAYGTPGFVDIVATAGNRVGPVNETSLFIQAAMSPTSRIRSASETSTAVYFGYSSGEDGQEISYPAELLAVALPAAWIVDTESRDSNFVYGANDLTSQSTNSLKAYLAPTPIEHSWNDWKSFNLFQGNGTTTGNIKLSEDTVSSINASLVGSMSVPFGTNDTTTVLQVAAISSAAVGSLSPLAPSAFSQNLSIGSFVIQQNLVRTVWRVLAGIAAGLGAGLLFAFFFWWAIPKCKCCNEEKARKKWAMGVSIGTGVVVGLAVGLSTGFFYGLGSVVVPTGFNRAVNDFYMNATLDNIAVCSQWPNLPCGQQDAYMIDGWFVDNPALAINIGQTQNRISINETLKVVLTNCNQYWDSEWNRAQYLAYFSTYFNTEIAPGDFLWGPGWWVPSRSQQIFSEYLDPAGLDALLEPILDSNMTTARLKGTTVDNPAYGVRAGQPVEMLLLNLNANITTFVVGSAQVASLTQPLADMASHVSGNEELVRRVRAFAEE